jgi:hypothetical protein
MLGIPAKTCPKWQRLVRKRENFSQTQGVNTMIVREKQCIKCGATKPTSQFKRRLSLAQSRAVLHNPNVTTNYMADSKLCKDCQPKRKPPRLLTNKEIRNRITDGDLRRGLGEAILEKRKEILPQRRSKVMKERWQKVKDEPIKQLKAHIQKQVAKFASRHRGAKYLQDATRLQNAHNYQEAKRVKDLLVEKLNRGESIDPNIDIQTLFKPLPTKEKHNEDI